MSPGLALICLAFGLTWPMRSMLYMDIFNMYQDIIRWKEIINHDLDSFEEMKILCSTIIEWRLTIYALAFHVLWVSTLFRFHRKCVKSSQNFEAESLDLK